MCSDQGLTIMGPHDHTTHISNLLQHTLAQIQQGGLVPLLKNCGNGNMYNKDQLLVLLSWPMDPSQEDNSWHDKSGQLG